MQKVQRTKQLQLTLGYTRQLQARIPMYKKSKNTLFYTVKKCKIQGNFL